jgi:hypothetical protein
MLSGSPVSFWLRVWIPPMSESSVREARLSCALAEAAVRTANERAAAKLRPAMRLMTLLLVV